MTSVPATQKAPNLLDIDKIRNDFPILHQEVNGKPLAFLDNAASSQRPRQVIDAISDYYLKDHANIHRGIHTLSQRATSSYEEARAKIVSFINAKNEKEVVFVRGATEAINLVASSYGRANFGEGDEIMLSDMEHHANIVPWQLVAEQTGAKIRVVPVTDSGELDLEAYRSFFNPKTKFVSLVHVSNALGTVNPVREIVDIAKEHGVPVLLDGCQAAPHIAVDVQELDADFYVFSGHKMLGPTGTGILWGREELLEAMPPYQGGGDMIDLVQWEGTTYNDLPTKFEAGTPHIAGGIGLGAAVDYINDIGIENIASREHELLEEATAKMSEIDGLRVIGTAPEKAAVLSFFVDGTHPTDIGSILDMRGVAVRTGHHCCQPLMRCYKIPATARASFAFYNTSEEIDQLVDATRAAVKMLL